MKLVIKVHIEHLRGEFVGEGCESEVVGRDEPDRVLLQETANQAPRADHSVVRIRAVKDLVKQEKKRERRARERDDQLHPRQFGKKPRLTLLERILNSQGCADRHHRDPQPLGANGRASQGEHRIRAHGPQKRALARHI